MTTRTETDAEQKKSLTEKAQDAAKTALAAGASGGKAELPRDGRFAETFVLDPVGTRVDLSPGWKV